MLQWVAVGSGIPIQTITGFGRPLIFIVRSGSDFTAVIILGSITAVITQGSSAQAVLRVERRGLAEFTATGSVDSMVKAADFTVAAVVAVKRS